MFDYQVIAFTGIAALLTITPGADTILVIRNVLSRGWKAGIASTFGICSGLFIHACLSAFGLSIILVRSATAFQLVKWVGAAYLIFLGCQSLRRVFNNSGSSVVHDTPKRKTNSERGVNRSYMEGFLTNVLNPKVAIFYLAFLPQFISGGDPVFQKSLLLAGIHALLGIIWLSFISMFLEKIRDLFLKPVFNKSLEALSGTILIGFGLRLGLEKL
jgi:RhtB (resistance to homoserine/threonine) family protein